MRSMGNGWRKWTAALAARQEAEFRKPEGPARVRLEGRVLSGRHVQGCPPHSTLWVPRETLITQLAADEARRRDIYAREPRIRAIDRELSATAIQVLRAALEQGSDPEKAIASLRERNLSLQEERSRLLRGLGLPADWLTNRPMCEKCGDTGYEGAATCECVKRRYARLLKQQLSSVLPIEDQNFEKFNLSYYSPRIDPNMHDSPLENMRVNLFECKAYARNFGENSPNLQIGRAHV